MESKGCRLLVPDGSLEKVVHQLLADAGIPISYPDGERSYRGVIGHERLFPPPFNVATKMRPWDSPHVIADKRAELAFTAEDMIKEADCEAKVVILDKYPLSRTGRGFTQLVVAVPKGSPIKQVSDLRPEHEVWTEYFDYATRWFVGRGVSPQIRRCHGSLEAFLEVADAIFENTEWGTSLRVGGWEVIEYLLKSLTCLITYPAALADERYQRVINEFRLLINAVIEARPRTLIKCNVSPENHDKVLGVIVPFGGPATASQLVEGKGFAFEIVVERTSVSILLPLLEKAGATKILTLDISRFVE